MWCCFRNMDQQESEHQQGADYTPSISTDSDEEKTQRTTNDDEPMTYGEGGQGDGLSRDQWVCAAGDSAHWHAWHQDAWTTSHWQAHAESSDARAAAPPPQPWRPVVDDEGNELPCAPPSKSTGVWQDHDELDVAWKWWEEEEGKHLHQSSDDDDGGIPYSQRPLSSAKGKKKAMTSAKTLQSNQGASF